MIISTSFKTYEEEYRQCQEAFLKLMGENKKLRDEIECKNEALKLSEEDRQKIIDNAHRSLRLHKTRAQGQILTESDTIEAHVIFETVAYIKSRSTEEVSDEGI